MVLRHLTATLKADSVSSTHVRAHAQVALPRVFPLR